MQLKVPRSSFSLISSRLVFHELHVDLIGAQAIVLVTISFVVPI